MINQYLDGTPMMGPLSTSATAATMPTLADVVNIFKTLSAAAATTMTPVSSPLVAQATFAMMRPAWA